MEAETTRRDDDGDRRRGCRPSAPMTTCALVFVVLLAASTGGRAQDNRCYLENGGSGESFFVSEAEPIGAVVGTLRVVGDPGPRGDITLGLKERSSPVRIAPGTKNMTLTQRLDKEGVEGPASVFVNVLCDRKGAADPTFVIPVSIRVTDANDNAPHFIGGPFHLNLSEVTLVGSRVLHGVRAVDMDQHGPFSTVQYTVAPGPYSDYFEFPNGLEGTLVLKRPLDFEALRSFTVRLRAQDQGQPPKSSEVSLTIRVLDADDQNPAFRRRAYEAIIPDVPQEGTLMRLRPEQLHAADQDEGIASPVVYSFSGDGAEYAPFRLDRTTGEVYLQRTISSEELTSPATLVVRATQVDNPDRYALTTLTVRRAGQYDGNHLRFLRPEFSASVLETVPVGSVLLTLLTTRPGDHRAHFWMDDTAGGQFTVTNRGELVLSKPLDFETQEQFRLRVRVTDGRSNDTADILLSVLNANDWEPRFRFPQYEFYVSEENVRIGGIVGTVQAADGDKGDRLHFSLRGPFARTFGITQDGQLYLADLKSLNASTAHFVVVAKDSGAPPHQASVPVVVHFPAEMVAQRRLPASEASFLLLVVFGVLLGVLAIVIAGLALYICKHKRGRSSGRPLTPHNPLASKLGAYLGKSVEKRVTPYLDSRLSAASTTTTNGNTNVTSVTTTSHGEDNRLYTATVRGLSSMQPPRSAQLRPTSAQAPRGHAPEPPKTAAPTPVESVASPPPPPPPPPESSQAPNWARGSIPRKVKKLSWEDEQHKSDLPLDVCDDPLPEDDPPGASTTDGNGENDTERPRLTIYF